MDRKEYLLTCLIEECSEVQKEATKALRFGMDDNWKDHGKQSDRIVHEFIDLLSIYEMLIQDGHIKDVSVEEVLELTVAKKTRVEKFMGYARDRGTLVE